MKKILLLAGQDVHCKVVETAKKMGIYTLVADYLESSPAKEIADEALLIDIFDIDKLCSIVKEKSIDAVVNFCNEPSCRCLQAINERLGLPNIGTKEQVLVMTDKRVFKDTCKKYNIDTIPEYSCEDIEQGKVEYPIIIKPVDSRGGRGITICEDRSMVESALKLAKKESNTESVVIEKFLKNHQEMTVTYIIQNGEPYLTGIADRYVGKSEENLDRQVTALVYPSRYTDMYMESVDSRVKDLFRKIGLMNTTVFLQGFVDGNTVRFHDPAIRCTGDEYERILLEATGLNMMETMINYFLTGNMGKQDSYNGSYNLDGKCGMQYLINSNPGRIKRIIGLDKIKEHPNIIYISQKMFEGDYIENTGGVEQRVAEIDILCERSPEVISDTIKYIQNNVSIIDEDGNNMIASPFDSKLSKYYF